MRIIRKVKGKKMKVLADLKINPKGLLKALIKKRKKLEESKK
jgi:hypothetical protein